jgi:hypothetical protein
MVYRHRLSTRDAFGGSRSIRAETAGAAELGFTENMTRPRDRWVMLGCSCGPLRARFKSL